MTGRISTRHRRLLLVFAVAALVALAGCSFGGGGDSPSASNNETGPSGTDQGSNNETGPSDTDQDSNNETGPSGTDQGSNNETGPDDGTSTGADSEPTLEGVTANTSEAFAEVGSFTLETTSRTTNATQSLVSNQTIRANIDAGPVYISDRSELRGNTNTTVVTESYGTGETVFVRNRFPDQNFTFYERQNVTESLDNGSVGDTESTSLADRYEFKHDRTADGDHRFTADSPEQFVGTLPNGTVERLSAEVVVDAQSGLVTDVDTRLTATTDRGELTIQRGRTLSGLGTTTVATPEWLDTARNRTVQSPQSR